MASMRPKNGRYGFVMIPVFMTILFVSVFIIPKMVNCTCLKGTHLFFPSMKYPRISSNI